VVFWWKEVLGLRKWETHTLTTEEAIAKMLAGEKVYFGTEHRYDDGRVSHWGTYNGGYKVQKKRAEKWQAEGYTLTGIGYGNTTSYVSICGVTPEVADALRRDLQDVERQREEWESLSPNPSPKGEGNEKGKDKNENVTIKSEETMAKKDLTNESKNQVNNLVYSTYEKEKVDKKTGKPYKVTHAKIMGFSETDEAYQFGTALHGSPAYETVEGKRVYGLYFSHRYAEAAKQVCEVLNAGGTLSDCKAIIAAATEENAKKRESWKAKLDEWKQKKAAKANANDNHNANPQPSALSPQTSEKTYTASEVADLLRRVKEGDKAAMDEVNRLAA